VRQAHLAEALHKAIDARRLMRTPTQGLPHPAAVSGPGGRQGQGVGGGGEQLPPELQLLMRQLFGGGGGASAEGPMTGQPPRCAPSLSSSLPVSQSLLSV
jgi:hypothetical protein